MKERMLFIKCEQAGYICDKSQYKEASWWQMFKLKIHLIYCNCCKKHIKNNAKLTNLCNEANLKILPSKEKEKIKKVIESEMIK